MRLIAFFVLVSLHWGTAIAAELLADTPEKFEPALDALDHERREVMIPMRDGVKLHSVILLPKGARNAPILFTRTPYDADSMTRRAESKHLGSVLHGYDHATDVIIEGGYIRVVQDVRGKYGSEGDYVVNRPLRGPLNPSDVDHATDTYDTIDWLVKNVPESNGRVGIIGISYDGFLPLMALIDPHPALKVSVPMNPMVDGWIGDDWFHNGARFALPTANHVFLPGHRIMVQVQSSWFPLYDRNPQTFVTNIFWARPEDFRKATQRIYHHPEQSSYIDLPILEAR